MEKDYEYPYGEMQVHEALEDLDRRLKALEPKSAKPDVVAVADKNVNIFEPTKPVV